MSGFVDSHFEQRLVERIALKEACASVLTARERRILGGRLAGATLAEIGQREGVCGARIRTIEAKALRRLKAPRLGLDDRVALPMPLTVAPSRAASPLATPAILRASGFDRTAFLAHMRGLITARARIQREAFNRELAELREQVEEQDFRDAAEEDERRLIAEDKAAEEAERAAWRERQHVAWEHDRQERAKVEEAWRRAFAISVDANVRDPAVRQRSAWIGLLAGTYGWELAMRWTAEYDAAVAADAQRTLATLGGAP